MTKKGYGDCAHHLANAAAERALVFFCLALYLGYDPKWVRFFGYGGIHSTDFQMTKLQPAMRMGLGK